MLSVPECSLASYIFPQHLRRMLQYLLQYDKVELVYPNEQVVTYFINHQLFFVFSFFKYIYYHVITSFFYYTFSQKLSVIFLSWVKTIKILSFSFQSHFVFKYLIFNYVVIIRLDELFWLLKLIRIYTATFFLATSSKILSWFWCLLESREQLLCVPVWLLWQAMIKEIGE